jgi:hypothetical protein
VKTRTPAPKVGAQRYRVWCRLRPLRLVPKFNAFGRQHRSAAHERRIARLIEMGDRAAFQAGMGLLKRYVPDVCGTCNGVSPIGPASHDAQTTPRTT